MLGQVKYYVSVIISLMAISTAVFILYCMFNDRLFLMVNSTRTTDHHNFRTTDSVTWHGSAQTELLNSTHTRTYPNQSNLIKTPVVDHSSNETIIMLFWSSLYGKNPWVPKTRPIDCHESFQCLRTSEKHFFSDSHAVVFHSRANNLRHSVTEALTKKRPLHQRWLLFADGESPENTPDLSFLNGLINWTASYMRDADVVGGLLTAPGEYKWGKFDPNQNYLEGRTGMAVILISHCLSERMDWVKKLQQYIDVDVYGRCGSKKCGSKEDCYAAIRKYKFYLSFENSYCKDYITEKFYFNSLKNGIVPVIISWVNTSYTSHMIVPPGSFINAVDFPTVKALADYMVKVGSSPDLYNEFFRWRAMYDLKLDSYGRVLCELCRKIHSDKYSVKSYSNIAWWFSRQRCCKPYPVPH